MSACLISYRTCIWGTHAVCTLADYKQGGRTSGKVRERFMPPPPPSDGPRVAKQRMAAPPIYTKYSPVAPQRSAGSSRIRRDALDAIMNTKVRAFGDLPCVRALITHLICMWRSRALAHE